jgi:hypothetical protein
MFTVKTYFLGSVFKFKTFITFFIDLKMRWAALLVQNVTSHVK